jgi:DNA-binding transcriptional MerR regulator
MSKSSQAFRTIREVADWLDVAAHVLRFWESKFPQIKPVKRAGGRRYYRPADMELVGGIKVLLHDRGLTIRGVQKMIREEGVASIMALSPPIDLEDEEIVGDMDTPEDEIDTLPQEEADEAEDTGVLPAETAEDEGDDIAATADDAPQEQEAHSAEAEPDEMPEASQPQPEPVAPPAPKLSLVPPSAPARPRAEPRQQASLFDFDIDNEEPDDDLIDAASPGDTGPEDSESMPVPAPETEPAAAIPADQDSDADPVQDEPAPLSDLFERLKTATEQQPEELMALRPALKALCDRMRADPRG